jgi:predicted dehydrogenase
MKLGIIGGWGHIDAFLVESNTMPEIEVVGITKGMPDEDVQRFKKDYSSLANTKEYENSTSLLQEAKPDIVLISTRLDKIAEYAIEAANAGCHLICEKPLAIDLDALNRCWKAIVENGVQCYALLYNRTQPGLSSVMQSIKSDSVGEIKMLNARKSYKFGKSRPKWCGDRSLYGGTIPWVGIHAFDFIDAVTDFNIHSVSALHANSSHPEWPDLEDAATVSLNFRSGIMASISIDLMRPQKASSHGDDWLRIIGDKGVIEAAMSKGTCTLTTQSTEEEELQPLEAKPYFIPLLKNLKVAGNQIPDEVTKRSFNLTNVALHAVIAADTNQVVILPEDDPWLP